MASRFLKGLTIKIGGDTSDLYKSLNKVDDQTNKLSRELGQINKLLNLDPTNTELLAQKQKVLADAISSTKEKLGTLREAEKQVQAQFERGEASEEQVRALRREIIQTEDRLTRYQNAAKEAAGAAEKLAKGSDEAAQSMDKQADKTDEAKRATSEMDDAAGNFAKDGLKALIATAATAVTSVVALAESSREYRTEIGKLNTAFSDSNHSGEAATKTYEELQSILGETDQAVEAANHLAKLCDNEEELSAMTEALTGVYATWGASLPIEGLAEAANETAKVGRVTGNFADAINWAADETTDWKTIIGSNSKALKAFNKAVKDGETTEDAYTAALEACRNEQERQQLIQETLTSLYSSAADTYKKTNAEVIRANQATERWNKTTAKVGKTVEPVVTDIKELGTTILEDASGPLEDTAQFIRQDVIPALKNVSGWVSNNGPLIKSTVVGATAALVAYKAATVAATVAQNGIKGAIMATTVAQQALNLVQAATPMGLITTAVAGLSVAMVAYATATQNAKEPVDVLTAEERELMEAAEATAKAFDEQKASTDKALGDVTAQYKNTQDLADELKELSDASGKVKEKDQERVNFILNELNEALGTEYKMVDGVIQKYKKLKDNIDQVIQSKLADALLETANADYIAAVTAKDEALGRVIASEKEYQDQKARTAEAEAEYLAQKELMEQREIDGSYVTSNVLMENDNLTLSNLQYNWEVEQGILNEKENSRNEASEKYKEYVTTINNYQDAEAAALAGNTQTAIDLLSKKGGTYVEYSDKVDEETKKVLNTLHQEAIDAGIEAERIKEHFKKGTAGYTEDMVKEAEQSYKDAMDAYATAYADAEGVGEDMGGGMVKGMQNKRSSLLQAARDMVKSVINAMRKEADSHSPSKKTIAFGEDVGEGPVIGIQRKTKDAKKAATKQVSAIMEAYKSPDVIVQRGLTAVESQYQTRTVQAAANNTAQLNKILDAIERGQVLTIDGNTLVGATAGKMDNTLGQRRTLAARGAL